MINFQLLIDAFLRIFNLDDREYLYKSGTRCWVRGRKSSNVEKVYKYYSYSEDGKDYFANTEQTAKDANKPDAKFNGLQIFTSHVVIP